MNSTRSTRLHWSAVVAAAVLATAGCAVSVPGTPAAQPGALPAPPPAPTAEAPPTTRSAPRDVQAGSCRIRLSGRGSISMSGSGGRAVTRNGVTSFACRSGPLVGIAPATATGVRFSVDGAEVEVAEGATAAVGPYQITIIDLDGDAVEFEVLPP